ncbi:MAG TPA: hypothetical protein VFH59_01490 [Frateuria sp.]|uniref:hypothetical protein n=1 Tax=Frateuria sp. TaxID=2211372 RepID=UPI002D80F485|nr:hypothetical protein [Frateuria sp.]HET6804102.1 hypothetical protein [Frateuria sp.]
MKLETLLLRSLFAACLLVCGWMMASMLFMPGPVQLAGSVDSARLGVMLAVPGTCMLPPDGVVCPRQDS